MKITPEELIYVANLARLDIAEKEVGPMVEQLDRILTYVEKLNGLDTESVSPTTHAISIQNAFRQDKVTKSLDRQEALANGPMQNGEAFVVSKVI